MYHDHIIVVFKNISLCLKFNRIVHHVTYCDSIEILDSNVDRIKILTIINVDKIL